MMKGLSQTHNFQRKNRGFQRKIEVSNSGFEAREQTTTPIPPAGFFDFVPPPGWNVYDPNHILPQPQERSITNAFVGSFKPSSSFFPVIPEDDQVASIFLDKDTQGQGLEGQGKVGLEQVTGERIKANTTYRLSSAILDSPGADFDFFSGTPGYELQLVAGDRVLASTKNTQSFGDGNTTRDSVSFTTKCHASYLGERLGIRLINLNLDNGSNADGGNGIEVNFDDVKLTATPRGGIRRKGRGRNDILRGSHLNDVLKGRGGRDRLIGNAGDDKLIGGRGRDVLIGGQGEDYLKGGRGADYLKGGAGSDWLKGGRGRDTFVLTTGEGFDVIEDFKQGSDVIALPKGLQLGSNVFQERNNIIFRQGDRADLLATLEGFTGELNASNFAS